MYVDEITEAVIVFYNYNLLSPVERVSSRLAVYMRTQRPPERSVTIRRSW